MEMADNSFSVTLTVTDTNQATDQININIEVVNDLAFTSSPETSAKAGVSYSYEPKTTVDLELLTFTTDTLPEWLKLDNKKISTIVGSKYDTTFSKPFDIVVDSDGNLYVADSLNHQIKKVSTNGTVTVFAGNGTSALIDGTGTNASFNNPIGLAIDSSNNIYVADYKNHSIRKITPQGVVTTIAGSGTNGNSDGDVSTASFYYPTDIALDSNGNIFVTDFYNYKIRKITPAGVVSTFAGSGKSGNKDGSGIEASFNLPNSLAIDSDDNIYVADLKNNKIRKVTKEGVVTTYAGSGAEGLYNSADKLEANFNKPTDLALDNDGNLYVSDYVNHVIRIIKKDGGVESYAGTGIDSDSDGYALASGLSYPYGLAYHDGVLYVSEYGNNKIKKVQSGSGIVLTGNAINKWRV